MIFLDRVGGGGNVNASLVVAFSAEERLRAGAIEVFFSKIGDLGEVG